VPVWVQSLEDLSIKTFRGEHFNRQATTPKTYEQRLTQVKGAGLFIFCSFGLQFSGSWYFYSCQRPIILSSSEKGHASYARRQGMKGGKRHWKTWRDRFLWYGIRPKLPIILSYVDLRPSSNLSADRSCFLSLSPCA
jgi:hypothetical protein